MTAEGGQGSRSPPDEIDVIVEPSAEAASRHLIQPQDWLVWICNPEHKRQRRTRPSAPKPDRPNPIASCLSFPLTKEAYCSAPPVGGPKNNVKDLGPAPKDASPPPLDSDIEHVPPLHLPGPAVNSDLGVAPGAMHGLHHFHRG